MAKRYNIKAGILFCALIALLSSVPRLIRFDFDEAGSFLVSFIYLFGSFFACWITHHFFLTARFNHLLFQHRVYRAVVSISSGILVMFFLSYLFNASRIITVSGVPPGDMMRYQVVSIRLFRGMIISSFTFFVVYYFRVLMSLQQSRLENEYLKQENLKAQLASLREQISPHFLFNSLNTLSALSQDSRVKEYILRMSEVYRYVLHYQQQPEASVKSELAFIRAYTYIMEARFEESLKINVAIAADKMDRKILPLALQLLVENAVKHNAISYRDPLQIDIYDQGQGLAVENDYRPKSTMEKTSGMGLHNLAERYRLISGKEIIITKTASKFKVEIPFLS